MKTWVFESGITLSESQLLNAVVRAIPEIRTRYGFFDVGLHYDRFYGRWRVVSQPSARSGLLRITRHTSSPKIVQMLAAACDRVVAKKLVGYVPGNRHNYLLELCQACKEAGLHRLQAKAKIERWAQRHGDEDRSYIVDMVYGKDIYYSTQEPQLQSAVMAAVKAFFRLGG